MSLGLEILKLLGVGIVSALLASIIQNRDHRYRKHWEAKVNAYQTVIEALSDVEAYYEREYGLLLEGRDIPTDEEMTKQRRLGRDRIRRAFHAGQFLFSSKAIASLGIYTVERPGANSWFEHVESELDAVSRCRRRIVQLARDDLDLGKGLFATVIARSRRLAWARWRHVSRKLRRFLIRPE